MVVPANGTRARHLGTGGFARHWPRRPRAQDATTGRLLVTLRPGAAGAPPGATRGRGGGRRAPCGIQRPRPRPRHRATAPGRVAAKALAAPAARRPARRARAGRAPRAPALPAQRPRARARRRPRRGTAPGHDGRVVGGAQRLPGAPGTSRAATGATVAVIDTGAETAHPELAGRVARHPRLRRPRDAAGPSTTRSATAPTSPRSRARRRQRRRAWPAPGCGCRLLVVKSPTSATRASPRRSSGRSTTAPTRST